MGPSIYLLLTRISTGTHRNSSARNLKIGKKREKETKKKNKTSILDTTIWMELGMFLALFFLVHFVIGSNQVVYVCVCVCDWCVLPTNFVLPSTMFYFVLNRFRNVRNRWHVNNLVAITLVFIALDLETYWMLFLFFLPLLLCSSHQFFALHSEIFFSNYRCGNVSPDATRAGERI